MTDRYAVIGNPVAHSKSPLIHAAFARETDQHLTYGRLLAPLDGFADEVARFAATGGRGLNVTVPFKLEAFALAHECTERARRAGAVNTLKRVDDRWYADNTDGAGLVHDLIENLGVTLTGKHIIVLGAGGAARGILQPILDAHPAAITIANRTLAKGEALAQEFARYGPIRAIAPADLSGVASEVHHVADVVINATSYGMADRPHGGVPWPAEIFAPTTFAYDLVYALADEPTPFMRLAREGGAVHMADGLGMLIEQAAESFFLWRGLRPSTAHVFPLLRKLAA
jgi:shikimate dehydrogenase